MSFCFLFFSVFFLFFYNFSIIDRRFQQDKEMVMTPLGSFLGKDCHGVNCTVDCDSLLKILLD